MGTFLQQMGDLYSYLCNDVDPRVKDWPLMQNPVLPVSLIIAYVLFIYFGPKWMAKREAFQLKPILIVYNFSLVIASAYTIYLFILGGWFNGYSLGCQTVDYSNTPKALSMASGVWVFFIVKYVELLDTVFFILRKKSNQVTFLHVFHHGFLPLFWWWGVKAVPGGFGTFHGLVNAFVHVVMYFYYGLACMGPKYQKYLWWKRYVTILQLSQFLIVTIHNSQFLFMSCAYPWKYVAFIQGFTTIVAVLFLNFYVKTYLRKPKSAEQKKELNGSYSNGQVHTNGKSNGHISNGHEVKQRKPHVH